MFGRRSQRDFEDEIRSHLQMEIERLVALGMPRVDAERAARRNFGNVSVTGDNFYHAQRFAWRWSRKASYPGPLYTEIANAADRSDWQRLVDATAR